MKEPKMKMKLAAIILICTAAAAQAGYMTFSGVITYVEAQDGQYLPGEYTSGVLHTQIGDTFSGQVTWTANRSFLTANVTIEPDVSFFMYYPEQYGTFDLSADNRSFDVYQIPSYLAWNGGTDGGFGISNGTFFAYVLDAFSSDYPGDAGHVYVEGSVTKQTVTTPDTGSTLALALIGFCCVALKRLAT